MSIKCLVFDCDGVILDSVPVKTNAFGRLAEPYGSQARDMMVMYHKAHGGVSRYRKFAWFFERVLHREITPQESDAWGKKFAELCLDEVRHCPMIPGAEEVIRSWHGRLPMYVCSGAPKDELELVLRERGLFQLFNGVYGSPPAKAELLKAIVRRERELAAGEFVMVGDAGTDRDAAEAAETQFYGIGPELQGGNYPWSMDLTGLRDWLGAHA